MVLLAICDANYIFTFVDIGAYGRRSDGGIFNSSKIGQMFEHKKMNLPAPKQLTADGQALPYVLVGDEAFTLSDYLLRPYPGRGGLDLERNIFNFRLCRARRVIENSFGIMVSKWRILKRPIEAIVGNTISMVQAIICLHNFLRKRGSNEYFMVSSQPFNACLNEPVDTVVVENLENSALQDLKAPGNHNHSRRNIEMRDEYCDFYNEEGAVFWQYNRKH